MALDLDTILLRFDNVKPCNDYHIARCPAHDDNENSLSISTGEDGKVLLHCHAGCEFRDILRAAGLKPEDVRGKSKRKARKTQPTTGDGLTLESYATAKALPLDFLTGLGVKERAGVLSTPYWDADGQEVAVRRRHSLTGPGRFSWSRGSRPCLYGAWQGARYREEGRDSVVLVEGESDTQTLWFHGIPAYGLPGANNWKEDRDASLFDRFATIYVVIEPDRGGEAVKTWIAKSSIRDRVRLVTLGDFKDVSALQIDDPDRFQERFDVFLDAAIPFAKVEEAAADAAAKDAWEACSGLATDPDILARMVESLKASGLVGEETGAKLLYLSLTSRLLPKPISAITKGQSSAGKSNLTESVQRLFPESAYYTMTASSERALIYSDESFAHRTIILYEHAGVASDFQDYILRSMLSEGHIRYPTVMQGPDGKLETVMLEKEGPTNLILTTTANHVHDENETRLLSIQIDDSPEQTSRVFIAIAGEDDRQPIDLAPWHALQAWLAMQENRVVVPFALDIARLIPPLAVRLRRDWKAALNLIRTHALLHQASRDRDEQGRIVATLDDYAAVYDVAASVIAEGVEADVPETIKQVVTAVGELLPTTEGKPYGDRVPPYVSYAELVEKLGVDKSTVSRRVQAAIESGYLRNEQWRKGQPAQIVLGDEPLIGVAILPTVGQVKAAMAANAPDTGSEVAA